jgi:hypothetical protein
MVRGSPLESNCAGSSADDASIVVDVTRMSCRASAYLKSNSQPVKPSTTRWIPLEQEDMAASRAVWIQIPAQFRFSVVIERLLLSLNSTATE